MNPRARSDRSIIDTHVHLGGKYRALSEWEAESSEYGVDGSVVVQEHGNFDDDRLRTMALRSDKILGVIGSGPPAPREPTSETDTGLIGVRCGCHIATPQSVSSLLGNYDGLVSLFATTEHLKQLLAHHQPKSPGRTARVRIEHLARPGVGDGPPLRSLLDDIVDAGIASELYVMLSGMFAYSNEGFPYNDIYLLLNNLPWGTESIRWVWSGDWNRPNGSPEIYVRDLNLVRQWLHALGGEMLVKSVFSNNATRMVRKRGVGDDAGNER